MNRRFRDYGHARRIYFKDALLGVALPFYTST